MNSCGSSTSCFKRILNIDSISLIDKGLFGLPISLCVNFCRLYLSRNRSLSPRLSNLWAQSCLQYIFFLEEEIGFITILTLEQCKWFFLIFLIFIVIQLQLYAFSPLPSPPPQLNPKKKANKIQPETLRLGTV